MAKNMTTFELLKYRLETFRIKYPIEWLNFNVKSIRYDNSDVYNYIHIDANNEIMWRIIFFQTLREGSINSINFKVTRYVTNQEWMGESFYNHTLEIPIIKCTTNCLKSVMPNWAENLSFRVLGLKYDPFSDYFQILDESQYLNRDF